MLALTLAAAAMLEQSTAIIWKNDGSFEVSLSFAATDPGNPFPQGESLLLAVQTMISSGFGASVGLEAGYTQVSASLASRLATMLRLRRGEVRMLVGCAAAGAFNGLMFAYLGIPSIVATLGTLGLYRGIMLVLTGGRWIEDLPQDLKALAGNLGPGFSALTVVVLARSTPFTSSTLFFLTRSSAR